jgi:hypothetical protein
MSVFCTSDMAPEVGDGGQVRDALAFLLKAQACAQQMQRDEWEFAVEMEVLRRAGLCNNLLRWLLCKGFVLHAEERRRCRGRRGFREIDCLSLPPRSCFMITPLGAEFLATLPDAASRTAMDPSTGRPVWDLPRRELRIGITVVKRFAQPAPSQERVLAAFEEEGWPPRIDDPLPPARDQDGKRRLHSTISNLNRSQERQLVRFSGGGDGLSVSWRYHDI